MKKTSTHLHIPLLQFTEAQQKALANTIKSALKESRKRRRSRHHHTPTIFSLSDSEPRWKGTYSSAHPKSRRRSPNSNTESSSTNPLNGRNCTLSLLLVEPGASTGQGNGCSSTAITRQWLRSSNLVAHAVKNSWTWCGPCFFVAAENNFHVLIVIFQELTLLLMLCLVCS